MTTMLSLTQQEKKQLDAKLMPPPPPRLVYKQTTASIPPTKVTHNELRDRVNLLRIAFTTQCYSVADNADLRDGLSNWWIWLAGKSGWSIQAIRDRLIKDSIQIEVVEACRIAINRQKHYIDNFILAVIYAEIVAWQCLFFFQNPLPRPDIRPGKSDMIALSVAFADTLERIIAPALKIRNQFYLPRKRYDYYQTKEKDKNIN
jgi:hypothetical protein